MYRNPSKLLTIKNYISIMKQTYQQRVFDLQTGKDFRKQTFAS